MHAEKQRIQSDCKYKIRQALEKIASIQNETQRKIEECQRQTEKEKLFCWLNIVRKCKICESPILTMKQKKRVAQED